MSRFNASLNTANHKIFIGMIVTAVLLLYWFYLAFVTQPIMVHDAKGYEDLGRIIHDQGVRAYFVTGPNREPIYPFLIAAAMQFASGLPYEGILKVFQFTLLFSTLLLTFWLLRRAQISFPLSAVIVFYLGISPALVNSALSVYSEIVTYVFVVGLVALSAVSWEKLQSHSAPKVLALGVGLGILFVGITLSKGIYEMIFPLFLIPFGVLGVRVWRMKDKTRLKNVIVFVLSAVLVFQFCIICYKSLNKKYNGLYTLTDRGAWALYGNTARRQEPLSAKRFLAGIAYNVLEYSGCESIFGKEACLFWDIPTSDRLAAEKNYEVIRDFPPEQRDPQLLKLSVNKVLNNPLQYIVLTSFDWIHMFFWESTTIGFVAYPDWLDKIFDFVYFQKGLRLLIGILSLSATLCVAWQVWCEREKLFNIKKNEICTVPVMFFAVYLIILHVTLYSLFATVPRFALPIAPLYLLLIAYNMQIVILRRKPKNLK